MENELKKLLAEALGYVRPRSEDDWGDMDRHSLVERIVVALREAMARPPNTAFVEFQDRSDLGESFVAWANVHGVDLKDQYEWHKWWVCFAAGFAAGAEWQRDNTFDSWPDLEDGD